MSTHTTLHPETEASDRPKRTWLISTARELPHRPGRWEVVGALQVEMRSEWAVGGPGFRLDGHGNTAAEARAELDEKIAAFERMTGGEL